MRTLRRTVLLALVAVVAWAGAPESDNAVAATEASATITFAAAHKDVHTTNDGASAVWVRIWQCDETPVVITTATNGARKVLAGEGWGLTWNATTEPQTLVGYCAITHITAAATTTTFRLFAK